MGKKKPESIPAPKDSNTPFVRFEELVRKVVSLPKKELQHREAEWQERKSKP
jgi:hypothetical protein